MTLASKVSQDFNLEASEAMKMRVLSFLMRFLLCNRHSFCVRLI